MEYQILPINKIELDLDNPRIKHYIEMYGHVSSEGISLALSDGGTTDSRSSYRALRESIKVNRGIINPIIVNRKANGTYIVVEGNTRLQIYREFYKEEPNGPWGKITSLVYDDMEALNVHAIRLQAHLVGPREWDPYSKAKYLYELSEIDKLPMNTIISYCGGKTAEVRKFIDAYKDMQKYYAPLVTSTNSEVDPREFSKFVELQNSSITKALLRNHFTKSDFAKWVVERNIDTAQNIRKLPGILDDEIARNEFFNSNIREAEKHINAKEKRNKILENIPRDELVVELLHRLEHIEYNEYEKLRVDPRYERQKNNLLDLYDQLKDVTKDFLNE